MNINRINNNNNNNNNKYIYLIEVVVVRLKSLIIALLLNRSLFTNIRTTSPINMLI